MSDRIKEIIAERARRRKALNVDRVEDEALEERISDRKAERSIDVLVKAERLKDEVMRDVAEKAKTRKERELMDRQEDKDICFIGYGNMARALSKGIALNLPKIKMIASDTALGYLSDRRIDGVLLVRDNLTAIKQSKYIFLAVKPANLHDVMTQIAPSITSEHVIVSILAGTTIEKIRGYCGHHAKICRVMPNIAATISKSISALAFSGCVTDLEREFIVNIFKSVGKILIVDESKFNAVTAVSGSGTAYVFKFMQAFLEAAIGLGLNSDEAKTLVFSTMEGAIGLSDTLPLQTLIANVSSPQGTTVEALRVFDKRGLTDIIVDAVEAACNRATELEGAN